MHTLMVIWLYGYMVISVIVHVHIVRDLVYKLENLCSRSTNLLGECDRDVTVVD